jgi:hypothetical protein
MALFYRILNFKFMHILCLDALGRKYFAIFTNNLNRLKNQLLLGSSPLKGRLGGDVSPKS